MPPGSAGRCRRVARHHDEHPKARPLPREGSACRVGRRRDRRHSLGRRFPASQDSPALLSHYATSRRHARATGQQKIRDRDPLPTSAGEQSLTLVRGRTPPLAGTVGCRIARCAEMKTLPRLPLERPGGSPTGSTTPIESVRLIQGQERALRPPPPASTHHRLALPLPLPRRCQRLVALGAPPRTPWHPPGGTGASYVRAHCLSRQN